MGTAKVKRIITSHEVLWCVVLAIGVFLRMFMLTEYPKGINQDEAYAAYEAYAALYSGVDSHGYHFPVYFISWGSGMNVLYSYLTVLFIKLGGLSLLTIRLPQALMGCLSLIIFYFLLKEIKDRQFALIGMFFLAINPWHIMICRWGLESNLAPAMVLLGAYFCVLGIKKKQIFFLPAFFFWGLALYAYAVMWVFIPIFVGIMGMYCLYQREIRLNRYIAISVLVLILLAIPLLLFVAVNKGYIAEIRTDFISIPKMSYMRDGEISFDNTWGKLGDLLYLLVFQTDGNRFNTSNVGLYYFCSIPLIVIGLSESILTFIKSCKKRIYIKDAIMPIWFIAAVVTGGLISYVNVNKINCIHLPMIYFAINGCMICIRNMREWLIYPIVAVYFAFFLVFINWYTDENKIDFYYGYEDALEYAESMTDGKIATVNIRYSNILLYAQMLPDEYLPDVSGYKNYDDVEAFGRYVMKVDSNNMDREMLYVVDNEFTEYFLTDDFAILYDNGYYCVSAQ